MRAGHVRCEKLPLDCIDGRLDTFNRPPIYVLIALYYLNFYARFTLSFDLSAMPWPGCICRRLHARLLVGARRRDDDVVMFAFELGRCTEVRA
jgi:hypothetical protein